MGGINSQLMEDKFAVEKPALSLPAGCTVCQCIERGMKRRPDVVSHLPASSNNAHTPSGRTFMYLSWNCYFCANIYVLIQINSSQFNTERNSCRN